MHIVEIIKNWLCSNIPDWALFDVADSAEYLGMCLGPRASREQWVKPFSKFSNTAMAIAAAGLSAKVSAVAYASKS
eukprot:4514313-Karenia_brevis.AAC.1